jgi:hypothetical protein
MSLSRESLSRAADVANGDAVDRGTEVLEDVGGFRLRTIGGVDIVLTGDVGIVAGGGELAIPEVFGVYPGLCILRRTWWERGLA